MLHERTSSAINLRMESSRRHSIRNLKAKVRAMLPADICPREKRRYHKSEKLQHFTHARTNDGGGHFQAALEDRRRNKIFQKLSKKEIEEINENKHYFLDNEVSIAFYESYVRECYPQMVQHEWSVPQVQQKTLLPFAFIPSSLINPQELSTYKKIASEKRLFEKRHSASKSLGILRKPSIPMFESRVEVRPESKLSKDKAEACFNRKQAKEEEEKVKREINSVHLQRQQREAEVKRQRTLKEKSEVAKLSYASTHCSRGESTFAESDITNLAAKLRKVCLHRRRESLKDRLT